MNLLELIRNIELFRGLNTEELEAIAAICKSRNLSKGEILVTENEIGDEFYIISQGAAEVLVRAAAPTPQSIIHLGSGQVVGEMALVDKGPRSATVKVLQDYTRVQVIHNADFKALCEENKNIGYVVMGNIAADLSFKLRHRNLVSGKR